VPIGDLLAVTLIIAASLASVCYFPLSVPYSLGFSISYGYDVAIPASIVLCCLALPMGLLWGNLWNRDCAAVPCAMVYLALLTLSTFLAGATGLQFLQELSRVVIPLGITLAIVNPRTGTTARLVLLVCSCVVWGVNALACLAFGRLGGVCANQNWTAAATVATAPIVVQVIVQLSGRLRRADQVTPGPVALKFDWPLAVKSACVIGVLIVTGLVVRATECRASLLAIACYGAIRLLESTWRWKWVVACFSAAFVGLALLQSPVSWHRLGGDIRIPVWQSTLAMIGDRPVTGHGPDQFRARFMPYRSVSLRYQLIDATVNHPHNEPLLIAANLGVPAAAAWLVFLALILGRPARGLDGPRMSAILLFAHGLLDLPLSVSPGSVLFPIFLGMVLADRIQRVGAPAQAQSAGIPMRNSLLGLGAVVAVSAASWVTYQELISGISFRQGIQRTHAALLAANPGQARSLHEDAYNRFVESIRIPGERLKEHLYAGVSVSEELASVERGRFHFEQILKIDPEFAFTNYLLARCDLREAVSPETSRSAVRSSAERALAGLDRELEIHPWTTRVHEARILALLLAGRFKEVQDADRQLTSVYQQRFLRSCSEKSLSDEELLQSWLALDPSRSSDRLQAGVRLTDQERVTPVDILDVVTRVPHLHRVRSYLASPGLRERDADYWRDTQILSRHVAKVHRVEDLMALLVDVESDEETASFHWPVEVLSRRHGTPFEKACLVGALAQELGYPSVIYEADSPVVALRWNDSIVRCEPANWYWQKVSAAEWSIRPHGSRIRFLSPRGMRSAVPSVFLYPQSFRSRNRALAAVLELNCGRCLPGSPHGEIAGCALAFPEGQVPPRFLVAPFEQLERELEAEAP